MNGHNQSLEPAKTNRFPRPGDVTIRYDLFESRHGEELVAAISGLYEAFGNCRLDDDFDCCAHCFTHEDVEYLKKTPVQDISYRDTAFILGKSISTLGSANDFNHFLPRVLESWAYHTHYMEHVIPERLEKARRAGWSPSQKQAVAKFLRTMYLAADSLSNNALFYYELANGIDGELRQQFPEIAADLHIELHE